MSTSWTHSRFWNSKRAKPIDCQPLERLGPLFEALAKEIELEGLHLGEDGYIWLVTASGLHIHFQQEDESLLSICELGRLTTDEGRMEMLETLLAANALWEGTKGATLSLEPTSDKMLPARKRTINELEETASKGLLKTMLKWCTIGQNSLLSPSPNPLEARVRWKVAD